MTESHKAAMDRLLYLQKLPREGDLSETRARLLDTAIAQQAQRVAHTDDNPVPRLSEHGS